MNFKKDITCPKCGHIHEEQFELTIKGKKVDKKPLANTNVSGDRIKEVIQHYLKTKNITDSSSIKLQYPRMAKASKELLMGTGGDVELIKAKITNAKKYFQENNLSWTIETVIKCWSQIEDNTTNAYKGWE
jgi:hypothetical protein